MIVRHPEGPRRSAAFRPTRDLALSLGLAGALGALGACRAAGNRSALHPAQFQAVPESAPMDVLHYAIDLRLDPRALALDGTCTLRFEPRGPDLIQLPLELAGLQVSGVVDERGRQLSYTHDGERLIVNLAERLMAGQQSAVSISYWGTPKKGLHFAGLRDGLATQVFTHGQCADAHWWFPCWDQLGERATSEVRVTMPKSWTSLAAGVRVERTDNGESVTERWVMDVPHVTYLETLVAGRFAVSESSAGSIPLVALCEPACQPYLETALASTPGVLAFLQELTGLAYPYPKYGQACVDNFLWSGMENISATTLKDEILLDERGLRDARPEGLIAHEAAHQWFGDLMTCGSWSDVWLNEGLATYAGMLYVEATEGPDAFKAAMRDLQEAYVAADVGDARRPTVYGVYEDPEDLFTRGGQTYGGAASRVHLLRGMLGDRLFFDGIRTYVAENQGRDVVTADFQRAMEKASGRNLESFFVQWFHSSGYPEFEFDWSWDETGKLVVEIAQVQEATRGTPGAFEVPVLLEVRDEGGSSVSTLQLTKRRNVFELHAPERPTWVSFDHGSWIPKKLDYEAGFDEALARAARDEDPNGRRDAIRALARMADRVREPARHQFAVAEIANNLRKHSASAVRVDAAKALGTLGGDEARERLMAAAASDSDPGVRVQSLRELARWGESDELAKFARDQYAKGYSYAVMAAAGELIAASDPGQAYAWVTAKLFEESPQDRLRVELIAVLAKLPHDGVVPQLVAWTSDDSASNESRTAAAKALGDLGRGSTPAREALIGLLDERDFKLRNAALVALGKLGDHRARTELQRFYEASVDPREKRAIEAALGR
jgi:aminopeptidase N